MKPKTDKQGWEEEFDREVYEELLQYGYKAFIYLVKDFIRLQREQIRREVVDKADLLLAMVQSTTEDTHHSEIIEMIGNIRNALSSDGEKKGKR